MGRIRSIYPDTCVSETMAALTDRQERTFFRLLTECDDAGRCTSNSRLLKGAIYPLVDAITPAKIQEDLEALAARRLIRLYQVDGKGYLVVRSWDEFQHPKNPSAPRYPDPPQDEPPSTPGLPQDSPTPSPCLSPSCPISTPLEIGDRSMEKGEGSTPPLPPLRGDCAETSQGGSTPPVPPVVVFPCEGKGAKEVEITQAQADEWARDFPGVNVVQELRNMRAWLIARPTKRKTARGIPAFVVRWLTKEQNNPRTRYGPRGAPPGGRSGSKTPAMDEEYLHQLEAAGFCDA
jgi:hypothetical protein